MSDNMTTEKLQILCDHCDWEQDTTIQGIRDFEGKNCPKCGKGPVISADDIVALDAIIALQDTLNSLPQMEGPSAIMQVATAPIDRKKLH